MGITPGQKGPFSQQFHFYLDVGNVLITKEVDFEGVCVADAPAKREGDDATVSDDAGPLTPSLSP